ncbi:MAG: glucose-6-phosphate isomerase [Tissierellia bacterium]|nr:glucose-6-phosphate isomerase [Tissierellia bacterium]
MSLRLNYENGLFEHEELNKIEHLVNASKDVLENKTGYGKEYLGWLDLPKSYDREEFARVVKVAEKIKDNSDVLVVIGIGGSYLGAKAAISALTNNFYNELNDDERKTPKIYFTGNNISSTYINDLINLVKDKDFTVNIISKSGTTTESAIAFRLFKNLLEEKYGKDGARERIIATTDSSKGSLKQLSESEGYETFIIPDDVGGRFSVLTPVGLLPIAVAGIDIEEMMKGALDGMEEYSDNDLNSNPCSQYAAIRNILYNSGKDIEVLVNYTPELNYVSEWWKQLYGESEGKNGKGIFPASVNFTTDLHSMGQMIQDGRRNLFETNIIVKDDSVKLKLEYDDEDLDGLNYLVDKTLDEVNKKAFEGTVMAHVEGNVPNLIIEIDKLDAYHIGKLFYFFEKACGISGYMLGVNPFDQPGVEKYKSNMFKLLGKPEKNKL